MRRVRTSIKSAAFAPLPAPRRDTTAASLPLIIGHARSAPAQHSAPRLHDAERGGAARPRTAWTSRRQLQTASSEPQTAHLHRTNAAPWRHTRGTGVPRCQCRVIACEQQTAQKGANDKRPRVVARASPKTVLTPPSLTAQQAATRAALKRRTRRRAVGRRTRRVRTEARDESRELQVLRNSTHRHAGAKRQRRRGVHSVLRLAHQGRAQGSLKHCG